MHSSLEMCYGGRVILVVAAAGQRCACISPPYEVREEVGAGPRTRVSRDAECWQGMGTYLFPAILACRHVFRHVV